MDLCLRPRVGWGTAGKEAKPLVHCSVEDVGTLDHLANNQRLTVAVQRLGGGGHAAAQRGISGDVAGAALPY